MDKVLEARKLINNTFELIKAGFDEGTVEENTFLQYQEKYEAITKGDPSHGGKLVKKMIVDKKGHKTTEWVKRGEDDSEGQTKPKEPVPHSKGVLSAFAKETPEKELKRAIAEHHDPKVRQAAHEELARREKTEKPQDKSDTKKPAAKKEEVKKEDDKDPKVIINKLNKLNEELAGILKENGGSFAKMPAEKLAELKDKFQEAPELNKQAVALRKNIKLDLTDNNVIHDGKVIGSIIPSKNINGYRIENLEGVKIASFENKKKPDLSDDIKDLLITDIDKFSKPKIEFKDGKYKIGDFESKNFNAVLSQLN